MKKSTIALVAASVVTALAIIALVLFFTIQTSESETLSPASSIIEISVDGTTEYFEIPSLDLRGYPMDYLEIEYWARERINYHRNNYGLHSYETYLPALVTSIAHSLDMRTNSFTRNQSSDGTEHQERHGRWMGLERTKVTSTLSASYDFSWEPITQGSINSLIDHLFEREDRHAFIMNATYYYIGIGLSIEADGTGRLCLTFASKPDEREAHHARTPEEREIYQQEYLERVRAERDWEPDSTND
jgi:hypothetical protein